MKISALLACCVIAFAGRERLSKEERTHKEELKTQNRPILFIKTHKTGSSTMETVLYRMIAARRYSVLYPADGRNLGYPDPFPGPRDKEGKLSRLRDKEEPAQQHDAIVNHAVFNKKAMKGYLNSNPFVLGLIRFPTTRLRSAYMMKYTRSTKSTKKYVENWENGTLAQKCEGKGGMYCSNGVAFDFGWYHSPEYLRTNASCKSNDFKRWLGRMTREIDGVVMTEHYNEGLVVFAHDYGLRLSDLLHYDMNTHTNPSKRQSRIKLEKGSKLEKRLISRNQCDVRLYNHFNKTFWERWAKLEDEGHDLKRDLRHLKEMTEDLRAFCSSKVTKHAHPICQTMMQHSKTWAAKVNFGKDHTDYTDLLCRAINCKTLDSGTVKMTVPLPMAVVPKAFQPHAAVLGEMFGVHKRMAESPFIGR